MTTMHKNTSLGYRGYIASLPINGSRAPQHIQNLVIRNYAERHELQFRLSATEFAVPGCFLALDGLINDLKTIDGVILYSLFMLPSEADSRQKVYDAFLSMGKSIHVATENFSMFTDEDVAYAEDIWKISYVMIDQPIDLNLLRTL